MRELVNTLDNFTKPDFHIDNISEYLRKAAARWSAYVVEYNTDGALEAGLEIAKAMVRYSDAIK